MEGFGKSTVNILFFSKKLGVDRGKLKTQPKNRQNGAKAIQAVQKSAVAGQKLARVFNARLPFEQRFQ